MNTVVLMGRSTKDPDIRQTTGEKPMTVARFNLAVDRRGKDNGADFINMVAFGKTAEIVEKYVTKGKKIVVRGHIQTGSYEKDGKKVYTTDVVAEEVEFAESKKTQEENSDLDDFVNVDVNAEELPFA